LIDVDRDGNKSAIAVPPRRFCNYAPKLGVAIRLADDTHTPHAAIVHVLDAVIGKRPRCVEPAQHLVVRPAIPGESIPSQRGRDAAGKLPITAYTIRP